MNKLTIIINGRKQSGRSSLSKYIFTEYLNKKIGKNRFSTKKINKTIDIIDEFNNQDIIYTDRPNQALSQIEDTYSVKIYDSLDPIKRLCINALDLDEMQCYGPEEDMNSITHIAWEDIFDEIRIKHSRKRRGTGEYKMASGYMTAKEVLNMVENEIFRKIYKNAIAKSLFSSIVKDGYELAIINNSSHPNEITIGSEHGAKTIRLLRNPENIKNDELEEFPLGEYSLVLNNEKLSFDDTAKKIQPIIQEWFKQYKLI